MEPVGLQLSSYEREGARGVSSFSTPSTNLSLACMSHEKFDLCSQKLASFMRSSKCAICPINPKESYLVSIHKTNLQRFLWHIFLLKLSGSKKKPPKHLRTEPVIEASQELV